MVYQFDGMIAEVFHHEFETIPCWIFLKWLPQIMSYMNTSSYKNFLPIIETMVKSYPEPCFYALNVTIDDMVSASDKLSEGHLALRDLFDKYYKNFTTHKTFVRALECMVHPE